MSVGIRGISNSKKIESSGNYVLDMLNCSFMKMPMLQDQDFMDVNQETKCPLLIYEPIPFVIENE